MPGKLTPTIRRTINLNNSWSPGQGRNTNRGKMRTTFEMGETFGIEIENNDTIPDFELPSGFCFTHDASVRTPVEANRNGIKISGEKHKLLKTSRQTHGVEVASQYPLKICEDDIFKIKTVIDQIYLNGGAFNTTRSGIHIHTTIAKSLKIIKTVLKYCLYLEDVFYYLGGMGQEFRGIKNDSIYCRPITGNGPQVVRCKSAKSLCQVFNAEELLEVKELDEFKLKYGNIRDFGTSGYPPVRYSWINFVTIFRQSSLEFRVFNTTLSSSLLKATISFCMEFTRFCLVETFNKEHSKELEINSIFAEHAKEDVLDRFLEICKLIELDSEYIQILYEGIENVPEIKLEDTLVYSHLMFHARGDKTKKSGYWGNTNHSPKTVNKAEVKKPFFEDVHNLSRR